MKKEIYLDELDKKILNDLIDDARKPFLEIARECGISGAAIHQRFQRLQKSGIIKGSNLIIDYKKLGYSTIAYVGVYLDNARLLHEVLNKLEKIPEIIQCHYTTGQYALFLKVIAKDNEHLRKILSDKIQSINGISRTETFISLDILINRQFPLLDD